VSSAVAVLERSSTVTYAQPNHLYRLAATPNDPRFGELWALDNRAQVLNGAAGTADADVDATDAWDVTTGSPSVRVAVVDSGVAYDHPDLSPNLWRNPGETGAGRETNSRDDDRNGFVDDWRGWDFADRDNDPRDLESHGSHVAGIAGARGNNGFGTAGVNWRAGLMALRVADAAGLVSDRAIVEAIDYAADKDAHVLNMSFVSPAYSDALRDAIRRQPKLLFVAASGNGDPDGVGDDNDRTKQYPCSFTLVNLVCVAASDQADRLAGFSNYGRASVDLAAPGANVLSSRPAFTPPVFNDGFETDISGIWVTGGVNNGWARITTVAHGGSYSFSDSPGTTYQNGTDSFVQTMSPFSLAGQVGCRVEYALRLSTEPNVDRLGLEVSSDAVNWVTVSDSSGSSLGAFVELTDDLSRFDGASALYLRFHLVTNEANVGDGAQLDDVVVRCLGSTYGGSEFVLEDGTSMAAPHVTGAAALIWAKYRGLGVAAVRRALLRGVDERPGFAGKTKSGGRLNVRRSLTQARRLVPKLTLRSVSPQRAATTGRLSFVARCKTACAVSASGTASSARGRTFKLGRASRSLRGGRRARLTLRLSPRARAAMRRALARRRKAVAVVTVIAVDGRGSRVRAKRTVRIRR
jgi:subtilisin family serine protease